MDLEKQALNGAFWANGYSPLTTHDRETGFKTHSLVFSQPDLRRDNIAEDFLVNSQMRKFDREAEASVAAYFDDTGLTTVSLMSERDLTSLNSTALSEGVPLHMELGEAMVLRRSIRHYTKDPVDFDYLSTLLRVGFGISATRTVPLNYSGKTVNIDLHMAPSGGGLSPILPYIALLNVEKVDRGIYYFCAKSEKLIKVLSEEALPSLLNAYASPEGIISTREAGAIFLLVGTPWRSMRKYGNRGVRFMFHEAGSIAQNIHLGATALGLGTCDCASFYDSDIHNLLKIDGVNQIFLSAIFLGTPGK